MMNLSKFNSRIAEDEERGPAAWDLREAAKVWVKGQQSHHHRNISAMIEWEKETVAKMNQWCGRLQFQGQEPRIAVHYKNDNCYQFKLMSVQAFKALFYGLEVATYNKKDVANIKLYDPDRHESMFFDTIKVRINPPMRMKKNAKGEHEPDRHVDLQIVNIADLWLDHPSAACYYREVCNPRPCGFRKAALSTDLNTWTGFQFNRTQVAPFKNWEKLRFLFNHIRYTCRYSHLL